MPPQPPNQALVESRVESLVASIDQRLPQTQCTQCDYPGCLEYAQAIASGEAEINQCPPGGEISINALSRLLKREAKPLNPENGRQRPLQLAFIRENACIGCKLCIAACPVDCIIGATKLMHTVIAADCSGCELCLPVCPTDCITLVAPAPDYGHLGEPSSWPQFSRRQVEKSRRRAQQKRGRREQFEREREQQTRERLRRSLQKEILAAVNRKQPSHRHEDTEMKTTKL